jgi:hypothetical protein
MQSVEIGEEVARGALQTDEDSIALANTSGNEPLGEEVMAISNAELKKASRGG